MALFPNHPHASSPQEAQNPGETSAYFLGGDFDLQEFCFPGQHLPWGVDPDKDRSLAFALQDTKGKEIETLVRTQRNSQFPVLEAQSSCSFSLGLLSLLNVLWSQCHTLVSNVSILFQICYGSKVSAFPKCGPWRLVASWGKQNKFINRFENYEINYYDFHRNCTDALTVGQWAFKAPTSQLVPSPRFYCSLMKSVLLLYDCAGCLSQITKVTAQT